MISGDTVDQRFVIEQIAGSGGMGVVYRSRDAVSGSPVAVKVLRGEYQRAEELRFEREAMALAELLHPSVVRLYDPVDTRIGGRTKPKREHGDSSPSFVRRWLSRLDGLDPVHRRSLVLPLALPGLINRLFEGFASGCVTARL